MRLAFCSVFRNGLLEVTKQIRHTAPHVDLSICMDGGSGDGTWEYLHSQECRDFQVHAFQDVQEDVGLADRYRNPYLAKAREMGVTWVATFDSDEFLEEPGVHCLRQMAEDAEQTGVTVIAFNAHDVQPCLMTGRTWESRSSYWNPMLFKLGSGVAYTGKTHITLHTLPGKRIDSPYRYFHIKYHEDQWLRGFRNCWSSSKSASNAVGPVTRELRDLCREEGIGTFYQLADRIVAGTIPQRVVDWMIRHKDDDNAEARAGWIWYHVFCHPELNAGLSNRDYPYITGRNPMKGLRF